MEYNDRSHFLIKMFIILNNIKNLAAQPKLLKATHFQTTSENFGSPFSTSSSGIYLW